jgi:hypothetical protein
MALRAGFRQMKFGYNFRQAAQKVASKPKHGSAPQREEA